MKLKVADFTRFARADLVRRTLRFVPGAVLPPLVGFALNVVAARTLGPADVGLFATAMSFVAIAAGAASQWISQSVNRLRPAVETGIWLNSAVRFAMRLSGAGAAIAVVLALWLFAEGVPGSRLGAAGILAAALVALTATSNSVQLAWDQSAGLAAEYTKRVTRFQLLRLGLVSAAGLGGGTAAWALAGAAAAGGLSTHDARVGAGPFHLRLSTRSAVWLRRMWRYGNPFLVWSGVSAALAVGDRPVLGALLGLEVTGRYALQYALATGVLSLISLPVLLTVHPESMRRWARGDDASARRLVLRGMSVILLLGSVAMAGTYVVGEPLTRALFGSRYVVDPTLLPILMLSAIFAQVGLYLHKPLEASAEVWVMVWRMIGALAISLLTSIALAPSLGAVGVAVGSSLGYLSYVVMVGFDSWLLRLSRSVGVTAALASVATIIGLPLMLVGARAVLAISVGGAVLVSAFVESFARRARTDT